jgi:energy-coupling factor transporter ATP-binding protein EcfA2
MTSSASELIDLNPYPGLRAFDARESDRFFGRRRQIDELEARLDELSFVAVAGTSGCGKSSLVRAGLLSELTNRAATPHGVTWRCTVMRPGNRPIANLAEHLLPLLSPDETSEARASALYGRLTLGGLSLAEEVTRVFAGSSIRVLIAHCRRPIRGDLPLSAHVKRR